jgi:hypothetical protein
LRATRPPITQNRAGMQMALQGWPGPFGSFGGLSACGGRERASPLVARKKTGCALGAHLVRTRQREAGHTGCPGAVTPFYGARTLAAC